MKKMLALLLALTMLFTLAACAAQPAADAKETDAPAAQTETAQPAQAEEASSDEHEPVTLEFLCWGAAEATTADAFNAMLNAFHEKYPWITVEVTESNYDAVNTSLLTRIASNSAPDVAQVSNQWVATYYEMGGLLPLDEYMSAETLADYYPGTMSGTNIGGHQYSATWITQPFALYCNMDLLSAAGYDHTPTTWDEMLEMAYAVKDLGKNADGNVVYGRTVSTQVLANAGYVSLIDVWANGGDFYSEDGSILYGDDATVAALTELQKEAKEGVIALGNQIVDNRALFGNNQVAFHIDAPSQLVNWSNVNVVTSLIPGAASFSSDHHIAAFANTEHPEECALFIDFMTGIEAMELYTSYCDVMPGRASVEALDYYKNLNDNMSVFYKAASECKPLPVNSSNFVAAMELLATAVQRVTIGDEAPAAVAEDTHNQLVEMYK